MRISDWSSDVCSSDLPGRQGKSEGPRSYASPCCVRLRVSPYQGRMENPVYARISDGANGHFLRATSMAYASQDTCRAYAPPCTIKRCSPWCKEPAGS